MKATRLALIAICLGFFIVIMDATIVNAALPAIAKSLHSNLSDLQWVVAGYTLSFVCLLMLAGTLVDRFGGYACMIFSLTAFMLASLACALAPNTHLLIVFRLIQGASATALIPASLRLINEIFQNPKERARAIGTWAGIGGLAAAAGPLVCSLLISLFSWRFIFFINIPIVLITLILFIKTVPCKKTIANKKPFDWLGLIFFTLFALGLALGLIEGGRMGWGSTLVIASFIVAVCALLAFIAAEKRAKQPIIPLPFFRSRSFSVAIFTGFTISCGVYGELFMLPLYFNRIKHYAAADIGFAILPLLLLLALSSFLSGKVISRRGAKLPAIIGMLVALLGYVLLLFATIHPLPYGYLILPLATIGFGVAFAMPTATFTIIHSVPEERAGMASGTFTTARQLGSLVGVAVFGSIAETSSSFTHGLTITLIIAGALALIAGVLNFLVKKT